MTILDDVSGILEGAYDKAHKAVEVALIAMIINILLLAVKFGPDVVKAIKEFINNLGKSDWTTEELEALVAGIKPPDEY